MKILALACLSALTLSSFAATEQEAIDLFSKRGEDLSNALEASNVYKQLAEEASNDLDKSVFKYRQSQSIYYFASNQKETENKEKFHKVGFQAADAAIVLLSVEGTPYGATPKKPEYKSKLAEAHYFAAINLGKWGEARGVLASLGQWGNMKKHLDAVIANDKTVSNHGAYRTLGRAQFKLPFTHGGSKSKSLKTLKKAYNGSFNEDFGTAQSTTTTAYLMDTLASSGKEVDLFCEVYDAFSELSELDDEELREFDNDALPEVKNDIQNFINNEGYEEDVHEYYSIQC